MSQVEMFDFRNYGMADYATVGMWFRRLPAEFRNLLNRSEEETLIWTVFYAWHSALKAGRGTRSASFSQEKTGEKFGRSRWTVARALEKLESLGLLRVIHRRPKPGMVWQTNLYELSCKFLMSLKACLGQKPKQIPCSTSAPQVFLKKTIREETTPPLRESSSLPEKERISDDARAAIARFFPGVAREMGL